MTQHEQDAQAQRLDQIRRWLDAPMDLDEAYGRPELSRGWRIARAVLALAGGLGVLAFWIYVIDALAT